MNLLTGSKAKNDREPDPEWLIMPNRRPAGESRSIRPHAAAPAHLLVMTTIGISWIALLFGNGLVAQGLSDAVGSWAILNQATAAELPAVAARLVAESQPPVRMATATNVVTAAIRINPAATPAIVGAVLRVVPETAAAVSMAAAREQPGLAPGIARAAAGVAPDQAREIVLSVCGITPAQYHAVALAAARAAPPASKEILNAICTLRPELKPYIESELVRHGSVLVPSVSRCLDRAETAQARPAAAVTAAGTEAGAAPRAGGVGPPAAPPGQIDPKPPHGGGSPPGGRNYARP